MAKIIWFLCKKKSLKRLQILRLLLFTWYKFRLLLSHATDLDHVLVQRLAHDTINTFRNSPGLQHGDWGEQQTPNMVWFFQDCQNTIQNAKTVFLELDASMGLFSF